MADEKNGNNTGSNDRATVALVAEKVEGLKELTRAGFIDMQRQLDVLVTVPREVVELRGKHDSLERRVTTIERDDERGREWKRGPLLVIVAGLGVAAINLLPIVLK